MPSPFPGMDPYLESHLWSDVHYELSSAIKGLIVPQISPRYIARVNTYTVEDTAPEEDVGVMYPDVDIFRKKKLEEPAQSYGESGADVITPPTVTISGFGPIEVRIPVVEIRDREGNQLITAIEVISPVNKRQPGLDPYREKRRRLHEAGVHLLEIDLIRRGRRIFHFPHLPKTHYLIGLTRGREDRTAYWAFGIRDTLPILPVPLRAPDEDVRLDLGKALTTIYDRSRYDLSIDYDSDPPPPTFSGEDGKWMRELLQA